MSVYIGAVAPESIRITVKRGPNSTFDFSTVSAAILDVSKPDKSMTTWAVAITAQTALELVLTHTFQSGETAAKGLYILVAKLTVPSGTVRARRVHLTVENPYAR